MMKKILALFLISTAAIAGFYPVNRGMINQATVGTVAAGTTTFVATQNQVYIAEGSNIGQTFKFPNATNLPKDWWYQLINNSSGTVTASDNSSVSIAVIAPGGQGYFHLTDNSSAAGTWKYNSPASIGSIVTAHSGLTGLLNDDHTQYHNDARGDARYFKKTDHINISAGAGDAAKPVVLGAAGQFSSTMIPVLDLSGSGITGLLPTANLANQSTTVNGTACTLGGSCTISGGAGSVSIGTIDSQARSSDGLVTGSGNLYAQTATSAFPGMVSTASQSFSGVKTFLSPPVLSGLTVSKPVKTNASGAVTSSAIDLATAEVTGLLPVANLASSSTTVNGQVCTLGSTCTIATGSGNSPTSIGTIDSQSKSANGLVTASTVLYAQTADATFPGLVSASTQTFGGNKTFNGTVNLNTVTASRFLRTDGSKNVTSSLINLANSTTDVTGTLPVGSGGLGITSTPTNGQIPIGNGTNYVAATITAGSGITVTNSAGGITINSTATGGGGSGYGTTSQAYVAGYSSAGSTNTKIIAFTSAVANVGTDVTYASSATLGDSFTINTTGLYEVAFNTYSTGAQYIGFTVNATQLSTSISSLLYSDGNRGMTYINGAGIVGAITRTLNLTAGDVVRAHYDGAANLSGGTTYVQFSVTRLK